MTHHLHSEADAAWKEMHKVMYSHQLDYDQQLAAFLKEMETNLSNMRDQVWVAVHTLAENEGHCGATALQVLNLLQQIPVDILFQAQIPLTITYCPESSVYRRWCPKQGRVSPLCKEVRASQTLTKVLGGSPTNQMRKWTIPHLQLSPTTLQGQVGCGAPEIDHSAMPKVLPLSAASDQALPGPRSLKTARKQAANPNSPMRRRTPPVKMRTWRLARVKLRF